MKNCIEWGGFIFSSTFHQFLAFVLPPHVNGVLLALQLIVLGVNLKGFPTAGLPSLAAIGFHVGIGSILGLYFLFWLKVW